MNVLKDELTLNYFVCCTHFGCETSIFYLPGDHNLVLPFWHGVVPVASQVVGYRGKFTFRMAAKTL